MKYKFALVAMTLFISTGANAQFHNNYQVPVWNPGFNMLHDSLNAGREPGGDYEDDDVQSSIESQAQAPIDLNYSSSKARTKQNLASFVSKARSVDPSGAAKMEQLFASTDVIAQIDQMMRPLGLRADNVADAYALWWVIAWKAANSNPDTPSRSVMQAVKQQAANAMAATPQFASASDALKQELAESMLIQAAMIDAHIDSVEGNPSQQAALAKAVNQGAKQMELDLTKLDLTSNGFVERTGGRSDALDADPTAAETDMAVNDNAGESDTGKLVLYGVSGVALLDGMFALGKSFGGKG